MCNLINTHTNTHTDTHAQARAVAKMERGCGWERGREDGIREGLEVAKKRKEPQKRFRRDQAYSFRTRYISTGRG